MDRWRSVCTAVLVTCATGAVGFALRGERPALDPAEINGAAAGPCFDCKDMKCEYCPTLSPCKEEHGYCQETVRNLSQVCVPRINGEWEMCKHRFDDSGSCVTRFLNPCTREHPICNVPLDKCGPMGVCIPEGICIP